MSQYKTKAWKRTVGDNTYYVGSIRNDVVDQFIEVLVIESTPGNYVHERADGYQRPANARRQRVIAQYLSDHPNDVVPPVILNGAGQWEFTSLGGNDAIGELTLNGRAHVIDGQHRLGGFISLWKDLQQTRDIDFVVYDNLDQDREAIVFQTINDTQVGVPKAIGVYNTLDEEDSNYIAWELNLDEQSPYYGKISRTGKRTAEQILNLNSVATHVKKTFSHPTLENLSREHKFELLCRYWQIIYETNPDPWDELSEPARNRTSKMLELTGFIAWSQAGRSILGRCFNEEFNSMDWEAVALLVNRANKLDWRKTGQFQGLTGTVGGSHIFRVMERLIDSNSVQDS